jgi:hypothetical protein
VRFMALAIFLTGDLLRECAFSSRTFAFDHERRFARLPCLLAITYLLRHKWGCGGSWGSGGRIGRRDGMKGGLSVSQRVLILTRQAQVLLSGFLGGIQHIGALCFW